MRGIVLLAVLALAMTGIAGCMDGSTTQTKREGGLVKKDALLPVGNPVPQCAYKFDGNFAQVCTLGEFKELPFVRKHLPSKLDGADIEVGYWLPDVPAGTKVPIVLAASPYYGNLGAEMAKKSGYILRLTSNLIQHGYAVAGISVRGTGDSGGCMDLMGKKELADLDQALTWLGEQPWSSGSIGMIGVSYDGSTPWSAAAMGNKYVKTIVPISGVPDVYGLMFRNGSAEDRGPFLLNLLYYAFFARTDPVVSERAAIHTAQGIVCPESWVGLGAAAYSGVTGGRDPAGWWAERNRKPLVEKNYKGSILSVQGLQDWNVDPSQVIPWVDQLNRTGVPAHQMLGQWGHNSPDGSRNVAKDRSPQRWDWAQILLNWYDYWLKGQTTIDLGPAVQVQDSSFRWHYMESFPPRDANWTTYHLQAGNALALTPGAHGVVQLTPASVGEGAYSSLGPLRESIKSLPGYSAVFTTPPLERDMRISGLPRLHVVSQPHSATGSLAAWLYDVDEQNRETRIGWTSINLMFADGTETMKPIVPNQELMAKMQFEPLDSYLKAGHRVRVVIWEYSDGNRLPAIPPGPVSVHFGGTYKSILDLPLLEGGEERYFSPPFPS